MFGRKEARIRALEQKVEELSRINKVVWRVVTYCGTYSPPNYISERYEASYTDVTKALADYLGVDLVFSPPEPAKPAQVKVVKRKKAPKIKNVYENKK